MLYLESGLIAWTTLRELRNDSLPWSGYWSAIPDSLGDLPLCSLPLQAVPSSDAIGSSMRLYPNWLHALMRALGRELIGPSSCCGPTMSRRPYSDTTAPRTSAMSVVCTMA